MTVGSFVLDDSSSASADAAGDDDIDDIDGYGLGLTSAVLVW